MSRRAQLVKVRGEMDQLLAQCVEKISADPKALGELSALGKSMKDVPDVVMANFTLRTACVLLDSLIELLEEDANGTTSGSVVSDEASGSSGESTSAKGKEPASPVSRAVESQEGVEALPPGVSAAIPPLGTLQQDKPNRKQRRAAARKGSAAVAQH